MPGLASTPWIDKLGVLERIVRDTPGDTFTIKRSLLIQILQKAQLADEKAEAARKVFP